MTETKKRPRTQAQIAAEKRYAAAKRRDFRLSLFRSTDADIIDKLESIQTSGGSVQAYIKACIRKEINRESND